MRDLLLRDLLEENLQDDEIVIFFDDDKNAKVRVKEIFFKYDAKKVAAVKSLSSRKYDGVEKKWTSDNKLSVIKETLKDFNLKIVFCFDDMDRLVEYFNDDFYKENEDAFICFNISVGKELKENYVKELKKGDSDIKYPVQVSDSSIFVLSDERDVLTDSRTLNVGQIKTSDIIGKVIFKVWPLKEVKKI